MPRAAIKLSDLDGLPLPTLSAFAVALARDVDAGADKCEALERVMRAIARRAGR